MDAHIDWNPYSDVCPTRLVLDRIADKWAVLIIGFLERGPQRFNALGRQIKGLSQKVLSQTLKRLERDGFVARTVFATVPITVEYALTPLGHSLSATLNPLIAWSKVNCEAILMAQRSYDEAHADAATSTPVAATSATPATTASATTAPATRAGNGRPAAD